MAMVLLWLGTCRCSFPRHSVRAAADAEQAARLAVGLAPLSYTYCPTVDALLSVGIQRLQQNKTWRLWKWPPAAKEFLKRLRSSGEDSHFRMLSKELQRIPLSL